MKLSTLEESVAAVYSIHLKLTDFYFWCSVELLKPLCLKFSGFHSLITELFMFICTGELLTKKHNMCIWAFVLNLVLSEQPWQKLIICIKHTQTISIWTHGLSCSYIFFVNWDKILERKLIYWIMICSRKRLYADFTHKLSETLYMCFNLWILFVLHLISDHYIKGGDNIVTFCDLKKKKKSKSCGIIQYFHIHYCFSYSTMHLSWLCSVLRANQSWSYCSRFRSTAMTTSTSWNPSPK